MKWGERKERESVGRGHVGNSVGTTYTGKIDETKIREYEKAEEDFKNNFSQPFVEAREKYYELIQSGATAEEKEKAFQETNRTYNAQNREYRKLEAQKRTLDKQTKPVDTLKTQDKFESGTGASDYIKNFYSNEGDTVSFKDKSGATHSFVCIGKAKDQSGHVTGKPRFVKITKGEPDKNTESLSAVQIGRQLYKSSGSDSLSSFGKYQYDKEELK